MKKYLLLIISATILIPSIAFGAWPILFPTQGGTGTGTAPTYGQILVGTISGLYTPTATSTLRINTTNLVEGTNLFYTQARWDTAHIATSTTPNNWIIGGNATTTGRLVVGTNPTNNFGKIYTSGDLFVTGNATTSHLFASEICLNNDCKTAWPTGGAGGSNDWQFVFSNSSAIRPTTTVGLYVTASSTFAGGLRIDGNATTTGKVVIGTTNPTGTGSLYVGGDTNISGVLTVQSSAELHGGFILPQGVSGVFTDVTPSNANISFDGTDFIIASDLRIFLDGNTQIQGNATTTATSTAQGFKGLNLLSCNTIDTNAEGHFVCGTDATGAGGGGDGGGWELLVNNILRPTSTGAGILVNAASSTITNLIVSDSLGGTGANNFWNTQSNATTTWGSYDVNWNRMSNATTTWNAFTSNWNTLFNATTTWAGFTTAWNTLHNATSTYPGFQAQFNTALNATTTLDLTTLTVTNFNSSNVTITGGSITGITDLAVADGGTGVSTLTSGGLLLGNGTSAVTATTTLSVVTGGTGATTHALNSILLGGGTSPFTSTSTLSIVRGGTGALTLGLSQLLLGGGTSPITALTAGTNGQLLIGQTSAAPAFTTISGQATVTEGGVWTNSDVTCTDCLGVTEIADSYLLNNGDDGTGLYTFADLRLANGLNASSTANFANLFTYGRATSTANFWVGNATNGGFFDIIDGGWKFFGTARARRSIILTAGGATPTIGDAGTATTTQSTVLYTTNRQTMVHLNFPLETSTSTAQWLVQMPDNYDGGTLSATLYYTATTTVGTVGWSMRGLSYATTDALDGTWGSYSLFAKASVATANTMNITSPITLTVGGTPAAGETVLFELARGASTDDTRANYGRVMQVKLEYLIIGESE